MNLNVSFANPNFGKMVSTRMLVANELSSPALMSKSENYLRKVGGDKITSSHGYYFSALLNKQYPKVGKICADAYKKLAADFKTKDEFMNMLYLDSPGMNKVVSDIMKENNLPIKLNIKLEKDKNGSLLSNYGKLVSRK